MSVRGRTPTILHGPGCNLGACYRLPPSCALLGGFAIGARVALLWQHNANPSYKLASIPRYDDIVRTAGWAGSARDAGQRPAGADRRATGAPPKPRAAYGKRARPPKGAFSTLLRQSGLRASSGGVLATKSERKMLKSRISLNRWTCQTVHHSMCETQSSKENDATQLTTATSASTSTATTTALSDAAHTETESYKVCLVAPRDGFALVPCRHERFCESCANRAAAEGGTCPVCRTTITMLMLVFLYSCASCTD